MSKFNIFNKVFCRKWKIHAIEWNFSKLKQNESEKLIFNFCFRIYLKTIVRFFFFLNKCTWWCWKSKLLNVCILIKCGKINRIYNGCGASYSCFRTSCPRRLKSIKCKGQWVRWNKIDPFFFFLKIVQS